MIPASVRGVQSSIVIEFSWTTAPITEKEALDLLSTPPFPSTWPDDPSYAPSLATVGWLAFTVAHFTGVGIFLGAYAAVSTPDDGKNKPPQGLELVLVLVAFGGYYGTAAVALLGLATGFFEIIRYVSSRRDVAQHRARVGYDKRRASLGLPADFEE